MTSKLKFNLRTRLSLLNLFLMTVLVGILTRAYFVLSRNGMWLDIDTSRMTQYILTVYKAGSIYGEPMYGNGFLYPILASIHSMILGVSVFSYQFLIRPFISLLLIFPAYMLAKRVFNSQRDNSTQLIALLYGYVLLNCLSVLIFRTSRGGHNLFTYMFIILYLSLLFSETNSTKKKLLMITIFFAVASSNVYFGTVLLYIIISHWIFKKITKSDFPIKLNFTYTATHLVLLLFIMFIIYPGSSINYVNIMHLAFYKFERFIRGFSTFSSPYTEYLSLWNSQITYVLLFQSDLIIALSSFMSVLYIFLKRQTQYLTFGSSAIGVYLGLGMLVALTFLLDKLGLGFGGNFGFRIFGLFLVIATLPSLQFFNIITKYHKIVVLILTLWLIISPITATTKAIVPPSVSGYLNSYSRSTVYSIKWLEHETSSPSYISTVNEFQPREYLENLVTLFAFGKLSLSDKGEYIFLDNQILWHVKWLKQHSYDNRYRLAVTSIEEVAMYNKIHTSGSSSFFSLNKISKPS